MKRKNVGISESSARRMGAQESMLKLLSENGRELTPRFLGGAMGQMEKLYSRGIDIGYIKTIIFPETNSSDIPQPLSSISFSRFSAKDEAIVSTGPAGQGIAVWYPRTSAGPCLFIYTPSVAVTNLTPAIYTPNVFQAFPVAAAVATPINTSYTNIVTSGTQVTRAGFKQDYQDYFTSVALTAASLQVQYIGNMDQEAGLMVGGHLFGTKFTDINIQEIENAQWCTRARPGQGLRFIHLPFDQQDFTYSQIVQTVIADSTSTNHSYVYAGNQGALSQQNNEQQYVLGGYTAFDGQTLQNAPTITSTNPTNAYIYQETANCVAFYWTGMVANQNWLRLDTVRRFNGTPKAAFRDIVDLVRPKKTFDGKKTFTVLNELCQNAPIGASTLQETDRIIDVLEEVLPNVSYLQENGGIQQVSTMDQLVKQLQIPEDQEQQLAGQITGSQGKRFYPF